MDMFMDKLAQKLTAQEMIKANMEADAEQMSKLKGQVKEYSECLEKVQQLAEAGIAKINEIESNVKNGDTQKRVEIAEEVEALKHQLAAELEVLKLRQTEELGLMKTKQTEELGLMKAKQAEELSQMQVQNAEALTELQKVLVEKFDTSDENVHKEGVKIYRNVQAVVVEENNKQTDNLAEIVNKAIKGYKGKMSAILTISIISMIFALGSLVLRILEMLGYMFY